MSVNWQIPALSSNEFHIILLIIHWVVYIDIFIILTLTLPIQHALVTSSYVDYYEITKLLRNWNNRTNDA